MFEFFLSKLSLTDVTDVIDVTDVTDLTETRTNTILATVIVKWAVAKTASNFNRKVGSTSTRNYKK
jgi:hypothetical protein